MKAAWTILNRIDESMNGIKTLLLADVECLSNSEIAILLNWVQAGGNLFFTANSATHNEYRRRRPCNPLRQCSQSLQHRCDSMDPFAWYDWMQEDYIELESIDTSSKDAYSRIEIYGKGKLGFWSHIKSNGKPQNSSTFMMPDDITLPHDHLKLSKFILHLNGEFELTIQAPVPIVANTTAAPDGRKFIHLINLDAKNNNAKISLKNKIESVSIHSPDEKTASMKISHNKIDVVNIQTYVVVEIS
jgi:hypothetical protein